MGQTYCGRCSNGATCTEHAPTRGGDPVGAAIILAFLTLLVVAGVVWAVTSG